MKIRLWLFGMAMLFLSACAISPTRVAAPSTDLQMLKLGLDALTQPRTVAYPIQHPDQAKTGGELFGLSMAQDDTIWLEEQDKVRSRNFYTQAINLLMQKEQPDCKWYQIGCKRSRKRALDAVAPASPNVP